MTSRRVAAFFWVFIFFLVQNGIRYISSWPLPSILLMAVIFYALFEGPVFGLLLGIFAGFFLDLYGTGRLGSEMIVLGAMGFLSGYSAQKLFRDSLLTQILLPAAGEYLVTLYHLLLNSGSAAGTAGFELLGAAVSPVLLSTAIAAPFFFTFLKKISFIRKTQAFYGSGRFSF